MKTIALLARKGGAGKTTLAVHMGVLAEATGRRVLFCDLDPQRSLSFWWHSRAADTPSLVETDARRLPELLREGEHEGYDVAVVDTPPAVTFDTAQVAGVADLALIPLRPSILDIYSVEGTATVVRAAKTRALLVLNACIAPTIGGDSATTREARTTLANMGLPVAEASLSQRLDFTRALNSGEAVTEFAPSSRAAAEMQRLWHEVRKEITWPEKQPA